MAAETCRTNLKNASPHSKFDRAMKPEPSPCGNVFLLQNNPDLAGMPFDAGGE